MPLTAGHIVDYINNVFSSGPRRSQIWEQLGDQEYDAGKRLKHLFGRETGALDIDLKGLPADIREDILARRMDLLGFDDALEQVSRGELGGFHVRKFATVDQSGYGSFALPRSEFIKGLGAQSADDIFAKLLYTTPSFQIRQEGASTVLGLTSSPIKREFLKDTAEHAFNADALKRGTRLVFDVESAGLEAERGIWQLSARLMKGDEQLDAVNLHFRNNMMDIGLYSHEGKAMPFDEFYEILRGGKIDWEDDFAEGMMKFFRLSKEADYLVGQNVAFDIKMLEYGIDRQMRSSKEFAEAAGEFLQKTRSGKVIDTRIFSMMTTGGDEALRIAPELRRLDQFTPFSMENILLETSFLDDLAERLGRDYKGASFITDEILESTGGHRGWAAIYGRLKAGMHHGDVDTWFEDHLFRMQTDILSGDATAELLRAESFGRVFGEDDLRKLVADSGSITPFTRVEALGDITPIEFLAKHTRSFDHDLGKAKASQLRKAGIYSNWADDVGGRLTLAGGAQLADLSFVGGVQAQAIEAGLPFAGLTSFERLVSTAMGRHAAPADHAMGNINKIRDLMGELTGSALVQKTTEVNVYGGKNVALPVELLQQAEKAGVLQTNFRGALAEGVGDLQTATWSPYSWIDDAGVTQRDVSLVADVFDSAVGDGFNRQVDDLVGFLSNLSPEDKATYGLTPRKIAEVAETLKSHGQQYGIQIGKLGGMNNPSVQRVAELLDKLGFDVDSKGVKLRVGVFAPSKRVVDRFGDFLLTTASILDTNNAFDNKGRMLGETRLTYDLSELMLGEAGRDPNALRAIALARSRMNPASADTIYKFLETNIPRAKKAAPFAAAGLAGYYLFRRGREQAHFDETFDEQGYESEAFEREGRQRQQAMREQQEYYRKNGLETAGTVAALDRAKIGHHAMGPNKHSHLFGG